MYSRSFIRVLSKIYGAIGSPTSRPLFDNGSRGRKICDLLSPISPSSLAPTLTGGYRARPDAMERFAIVKRSDFQRGGHEKDPKKLTEPVDAAVTSASILDIFVKLGAEIVSGLPFISILLKNKSRNILPGYSDLVFFVKLERGYVCIVERFGKLNRVLYAKNSSWFAKSSWWFAKSSWWSKHIPLYHYVIPFVERVAYTQWIGIRCLEVIATGLSNDNFELQLNSVFYLEIVDPFAAYEIGESNATRKLREIAELTLMTEVGKIEAGRLLKMKKLQYQLEENVQVSMDAAVKIFGARCKLCLLHVDVPTRIRKKMESQEKNKTKEV